MERGLQRYKHVLQDVQVGQELWLAEKEAYLLPTQARAFPGRQVPHLLPIQVYRASRRPTQATDQAQQVGQVGNLSYWSGIQDGYELTWPNLQAKPLQDIHRPFDRAPLDYPFGFAQGRARDRQDSPLASEIRLAQVKYLQDRFGLLMELFPNGI